MGKKEDIGNKRVKEFVAKFLAYMEKQWLSENYYKIAEWNFFFHRGVTSNNYAEGEFYEIFLFKFKNKKWIDCTSLILEKQIRF